MVVGETVSAPVVVWVGKGVGERVGVGVVGGTVVGKTVGARVADCVGAVVGGRVGFNVVGGVVVGETVGVVVPFSPGELVDDPAPCDDGKVVFDDDESRPTNKTGTTTANATAKMKAAAIHKRMLLPCGLEESAATPSTIFESFSVTTRASTI